MTTLLITQKKGLFDHREALYTPSKKYNTSHVLMYGKHTLTTLLIKNLIFQGEKTKLPSIYPRFTIKYI